MTPPVTSGSQKTGCPNRNLGVWTTGESTPSAALDGPVNVRGLKSHPGRTDFPEFLPIGAKAAPFNPISR